MSNRILRTMSDRETMHTEIAKTAVEIAIEQGEDKAMELLTQNM